MAFERIKEIYEILQVPTRFRISPLEIGGAGLGTGIVTVGFIDAVAGQETVGGYIIAAGSLVFAGVGVSIANRFRPQKVEEVNLPPSHEAFETHDSKSDDLLSQFPDLERNFYLGDSETGWQGQEPEHPETE